MAKYYTEKNMIKSINKWKILLKNSCFRKYKNQSRAIIQKKYYIKITQIYLFYFINKFIYLNDGFI